MLQPVLLLCVPRKLALPFVTAACAISGYVPLRLVLAAGGDVSIFVPLVGLYTVLPVAIGNRFPVKVMCQLLSCSVTTRLFIATCGGHVFTSTGAL